MIIEQNISLAPLTTFGIGGPARFFARVHTVEELRECLAFAKEKNLKIFILGGGSNVLVPDGGFDGFVIKIEIGGIELQNNADKKLVIAGAGESWDALVTRAVSEGLWGLENLSGIPGSVGGAVVGSIGAYGAAVEEHFTWAEVFDSESGEIKKMSRQECVFDYRDSFFKHDGGRHIVLRAAFALSPTGAPTLSYKDVAARFKDGASPSLAHVRDVIIDIRKGKFPDLGIEGTAGSFFKNPILPSAEAQTLQAQYPDMPLFAMPETAGVKVPLAWLIDNVLHLKGTKVGGARLFERQPLVIAATHGTSSSDVRALANIVTTAVKEKCNIDIEPEVKIL